MADSMISILIPAYRVDLQKFEACIKSIRSQSPDGVDIIVGLQGKEDGILGLAKKYDFCLVNFDHPSSYITRIRLIDYVKTDYVWFVDADDEISPGSLSALEATIKTSNFPDVICFGIDIPYLHKTFRPVRKKINSNKDVISTFYDSSIFHNAMWQKLFKTSVLRQTIFPKIDIFYCDDRVATLACLKECQTAFSVDDVFYIYKEQGGSNKKRCTIQRMKDMMVAFDYVEDNSFNEQGEACFRNVDLVETFLSTFFAWYSINSDKKDVYDALIREHSWQTVLQYIKIGETRPLIKNFCRKTKIKALLFFLFSKRHFAFSKTVCSVLGIFRK